MDSILNDAKLVKIDKDVYRNIVSLRQSEDLFDDLSDNPDDWALAQTLEANAKPPNYRSEQIIINRPFDEAEYFGAIGYPFSETNWQQSRFSTGNQYGVWYGAESLDTTIYETVHHWRNSLLADAGWEKRDDISIHRKIYTVCCQALLIDLSNHHKDFPFLISDDYEECQQLGRLLHQQGHPGIFTRSARCKKSGNNVVVFNEKVLSEPKNHCNLTYRLNGNQVTIERTVGDVEMAIEY